MGLSTDFDDFVTMTTRASDVPSGRVFSNMTLTSISWTCSASLQAVVTVRVEWTGRSLFKGAHTRSL
jgi:hypothetical protein